MAVRMMAAAALLVAAFVATPAAAAPAPLPRRPDRQQRDAGWPAGAWASRAHGYRLVLHPDGTAQEWWHGRQFRRGGRWLLLGADRVEVVWESAARAEARIACLERDEPPNAGRLFSTPRGGMGFFGPLEPESR